jgi:hypothetical protein
MRAERVFADNKKSLQFHQDSRKNHANQGCTRRAQQNHDAPNASMKNADSVVNGWRQHL